MSELILRHGNKNDLFLGGENIIDLINHPQYPIMELTCIESSNPMGDFVLASAVTKVNRPNTTERLKFVTEFVGYNLPEPKIIRGVSYADTKYMTVADRIVNQIKSFSRDDIFKVIILTKECVDRVICGNAGHKVYKMIGIVLKYPDELPNIA